MRFKALLLSAVIISIVLPSMANAKRYWPSQTLTDWTLYLNNGVAYIASPQFAGHCSYSRGQIQMNGIEFDKAQYAYAMSAKARNKSLKYVIDDTQSTCIITGLKELD